MLPTSNLILFLACSNFYFTMGKKEREESQGFYLNIRR